VKLGALAFSALEVGIIKVLIIDVVDIVETK
jgi:hypothetical protein